MDAEALRARDEIRDVLARYARGVDGRDLTEVADCFTPDAAYDGALGRGTVADALRTLATAMTRYTATMHLMGRQSIDVAADGAHSETDCVAVHVLPGGAQRTVAVRYTDELVRANGAWRIASRRVHTLWETSHG